MPADHTHEASLSVSNGTSNTTLETHSRVSTPADATNPPPKLLPSGLDIPVTDEPMDLDNDPLQDSIQRVLQAATAVHQRPTWSFYRALNETDQRITGTEGSWDPGAYIPKLRHGIEDTCQQSPEGVVVQRQVSKTGSWTNLAGSRHAQQAFTLNQESDATPPATHVETAAALVLTLHSWTRGHTIVLHEKISTPMHVPRHTDRPTRQRAKPTWNGHENEKTTNTPWYRPPATGTGWPKGKNPHPNRPQPPQGHELPDTGPYTNN